MPGAAQPGGDGRPGLLIERVRVIHTQCPGCKTRFAVNERMVGRMATCSACGSVFTVRPLSGGAAAGAVIDVKAEVISDSADAKADDLAADDSAETASSTVFEPARSSREAKTEKRRHGWAGFDPARYPGNASRVRTFYFERRYGQGPNCCSFGCFGMAFIVGILVYLTLSALFG